MYFSDPSQYYPYYANRWLEVKPIRGRSVDTRPVGKRARDWETITREERGDTVIYGLKLHSTTCVEYYPDGNVLIRHGNWQTPSTAKFINEHSPMACFKERGKLYVRKHGGTKYPLTANGIMFKPQGDTYVPVEPVMVTKSVVDRALARDARVPLQPFLDYARAFLSLSDGWVMHETRKQVLGWNGTGFVRRNPGTRELYDQLLINPNDETYLYVLCMLPDCMHMGSHDVRAAEKAGNYFSRLFCDYRVSPDRAKSAVYGWVKQYAGVMKDVEVQIT